MDDESRQLASSLLGQLVEIVGVTQVPSNIQQAANSPAQITFSDKSERSEPTSSLNVTPTFANNSVTGSNILSEARQLFGRYPRMINAAAFRMTGRTPARRTATSLPVIGRRYTPVSRPWFQRFCCLSGPSECKTPSSNRLLFLKNLGLGDEPVTSDCKATSSELEAAIRVAFPTLGSAGLELLKAVSGGSGKALVRFSNNSAIPSAEEIRSYRATIVYVRPLIEVIHQGVEDEMTDIEEVVQDSVNTSITNAQISQNSSSGQNELHSVAGSSEVNRNGLLNSLVTVESPPTNSRNLDGQRTEHNTSGEIEEPVASTSATRSQLNCQNSTNGEPPITMDEYRTQLYEVNPGMQYIQISRDNFIERLLGIYKNPSFNFAKKPMVEFIGESGTDIGALSKEFFWKGLTSLLEDKLDGRPLFEGQEGFKVPSCDARLARSGIFKAYLIAEKPDCDTPFSLKVEDCPDFHIQECLRKLLELQRGASLREEEINNMQSVATASSEFNEVITKENALLAYQHILYYTVIEKRIAQLEALKEGIKATGLLDFIKGKCYLVPGIFPRIMDLQYPASMVITKIESNIEHEIKENLVSFIQELETRASGIQKLLCAWTGWALIPDTSLKLTILPDVDFIARACFNELIIPSNFTKKELLSHMELLVNDGHYGFGSI